MSLNTNYIYDPIEVDADELQTAAYDYLTEQWPDWKPEQGNLETWMVVALADMSSEAADVASDVPPAIFKYFGEKIVGVPPIHASVSMVNTSWTAVAPAGVDRLLPANTMVSIPGADGDPVYFATVADTTLGSGQVNLPNVTIASIDEGAVTDGLGGPGAVVTPVDPVAWVLTITSNDFTSGGADEEDDDAYLNRLSSRLTLMSPRPILPLDFAVLAKDIALQNGVNIRALAIDGYNPDDGSSNNERYITITAMDAVSGANISAGLMTVIRTTLDSLREVNFVVKGVNPTRIGIDVNFTIVVKPGFDKPTVTADAVQAVKDWLNPVNWGGSDFTTAPGQDWYVRTTARFQDLVTVLNNVSGVDYYTVLQWRTGVAAFGNADIVLSPTDPTTITTFGVVNGAYV